MSHKDLNPVNRKNPKRVAIVISNPVVSTTTNWPVGFWWAELSHPYFRFTELGYQAEIFSPEGGACAADARSDPEDASQWQAEDVISRGYKHDPDFMNLVQNTKTVDEISPSRLHPTPASPDTRLLITSTSTAAAPARSSSAHLLFPVECPHDLRCHGSGQDPNRAGRTRPRAVPPRRSPFGR